jgi:hypothetical protein
MSTPEGKVKDKIKKLLDRYEENLYYFMPVQMGLGSRTVDFLCCANGRFFSIEAKAKAGRTTRLQERVMERMRRSGATTFLIVGTDDTEGFGELEEYLEGIMVHG